jgi:Na+/H+-dicarboxylate symporter
VSSLGVLAASAGAGMMAAALDTPADTIKTRLQAGSGKYTGIVDCVKKTLAEEGVHAFTKGLIPRILIISPLFGMHHPHPPRLVACLCVFLLSWLI